MPRRISFSDQQLKASYLAGQSTTILAQRYGCSPTTIAKHLRAAGVALRQSRFVAAAIDQAALKRAYLDQQLPIAEIARRFGVSASTIGNKRRAYGIPLRLRRRTGAKNTTERTKRTEDESVRDFE